MPENPTVRRPAGVRTETSRVGKRGAIVVPARMRRKFGIEEGSLVIAEERNDGILIRPAVAVPVEIYTPARVAEFLLSNAVDAKDYRARRCEPSGSWASTYHSDSGLLVLWRRADTTLLASSYAVDEARRWPPRPRTS